MKVSNLGQDNLNMHRFLSSQYGLSQHAHKLEEVSEHNTESSAPMTTNGRSTNEVGQSPHVYNEGEDDEYEDIEMPDTLRRAQSKQSSATGFSGNNSNGGKYSAVHSGGSGSSKRL